MQTQEIFDIVIDHLFTQGQQALDDYGSCVYRGPCGTKCAVGALISDDEYSGDMEAKKVSDLVVQRLLPTRLIPHETLLISLQLAHDNVQYWCEQGLSEAGIASLRRTARRECLSTQAIDRRTAVVVVN